ncbi:MAG: nucleotide exchange factor GrpE [Opitutales bacterium]|nr:nucleotide exchange factor GrpE [Opitutales bacterium]
MKDEEKNTCSEQCVEENQEHCQCDCQCEADCMANEEQSINISEIESELDKALASASENRDLYLRAVADLDTYRRKVQREKQELSKFALQPLIEELLPSIDHLDMAIQACTTPECANIKIGVEMVSTQIKKVLSNFGVEEVVVLGKAFDPNTSECVSHEPSNDVAENDVIKVVRAGYMFNGRLIRPASVVVSSGKE